MSDTAKIFILLKDPKWDGLKPDKVHLFGKKYATDGSEELLDDVASDGLKLMRSNLVYSDEYGFTYWTYIPLTDFIDCFVTDDLFNDKKAWNDFRGWMESIVTEWCISNDLSLKIERDKTRQYYIKFTITVTPEIAVS